MFGGVSYPGACAALGPGAVEFRPPWGLESRPSPCPLPSEWERVFVWRPHAVPGPALRFEPGCSCLARVGAPERNPEKTNLPLRTLRSPVQIFFRRDGRWRIRLTGGRRGHRDNRPSPCPLPSQWERVFVLWRPGSRGSASLRPELQNLAPFGAFGVRRLFERRHWRARAPASDTRRRSGTRRFAATKSRRAPEP